MSVCLLVGPHLSLQTLTREEFTQVKAMLQKQVVDAPSSRLSLSFFLSDLLTSLFVYIEAFVENPDIIRAFP
jgi:hypothetical protein